MAEAETTNEEKKPEQPGPDWVPRSRFNELSNQMREMKAQLDEERRAREELQDADKPHLERLTKDNERLAKRAEEAEARAAEADVARQRDQKAAWLASAAAKANFHDPDIASRMVDLESIEDAAGAEKAVKNLAKDKSFLVKEETKQSPLQRVGIAGAEQGGGQQQGLITPAQQEREWGEEILKGLDPSAVPSE